ncbi:MAG: D-alanine--D-alanine ligase [Actinomycetota bacterium]|nr:D-alanine--D-alanine ligase [Actinomycetota bacterium]
MARVLLLFGGRSAEHQVSCVSAAAVGEALRQAGHQVSAVGIDRDGGWHQADTGRRPMVAEGPPAGFEVPAGSLRAPGGVVAFEVVFPVLHGPFGEDGALQGMLEMAGVRYVGSGVLGSAIGMDKDVAKRLFRQAGLPTVAYQVVRGPDYAADPGGVVGRVAERLGLPVFTKPARLGSSLGVTDAASEAEVKQGIEEALRHGDKVLVEEAVRGREIEVAVLEGPRASVPGEIVPTRGWYDYRAKYEDDSAILLAPAPLTQAESVRVRELAKQAFTVLECSGLARVDFFYEEGGRGFLLNEVNTMPGFTPISMFPRLWQESGMSYPELVDELVRLALQ